MAVKLVPQSEAIMSPLVQRQAVDGHRGLSGNCQIL